MNDDLLMIINSLEISIANIEKSEEYEKRTFEEENPGVEYCDMWCDGYIEGLKTAHDSLAFTYNKNAKCRIHLYDEELERVLESIGYC